VTPRELSLVLLSALLHALWNLSAKGSQNPVAFALLLRTTMACMLMTVLPFFELRDVPSEVWWIIGGSTIVHTFYLYCLSKGYQSGDLSLVYPIARSTPAFVPLAAAPLLGERISPLGALGIAVVVAGIWLVHAEGWRWRNLAHPGLKYALLTLAATVGYSLLDKHGMETFAEAVWSGPAPRALAFLVLLEAAGVPLFFPLALREVGAAGLRRAIRVEFWSVARAALAATASYALILEALGLVSLA
jgi:drug/metabolite transporter (DMT)-like permease